MSKKTKVKQNRALTKAERVRNLLCFALTMTALFLVTYNNLYKRYVIGVLNGDDVITAWKNSGILKHLLLILKLAVFNPIAETYSPTISFMFSLILMGPVTLLAGKLGMKYSWNPTLSVIFAWAFAAPVDYLHEVCLYFFSDYFKSLDEFLMEYVRTEVLTVILVVYTLMVLAAVIISVAIPGGIRKKTSKVHIKKKNKGTQKRKAKRKEKKQKPYVEKYVDMWIEITNNDTTTRIDGKAIKKVDKLIKKETEKLNVLERECEDIKKKYHIPDNI